MGAVQWWDHSRVWLDEYDQSLKICKSMNTFYQPNRQTNPPKEILLRIIRSFLEQKPQYEKYKNKNITPLVKKKKKKEHKNNIRKHTKKKKNK